MWRCWESAQQNGSIDEMPSVSIFRGVSLLRGQRMSPNNHFCSCIWEHLLVTFMVEISNLCFFESCASFPRMSLLSVHSYFISIRSGKEKAHKHKQFCPVTAWVRGGSTDRVVRGQMFMCCVRNPRNINIFVRVPGREDRWPGSPRNCLCVKCLCAFSGLY